MCSKLKSFKVLKINSNGSVYFDHLAYLKTYKKYNFLEVPLDETDYERADIQMELIL